jgi:hypothetical protein
MDRLVAAHRSNADVASDDGVRSLEVRWIRPGLIPDPMIGRLGPFSEQLERREDRYLLDPWLPELSVKIRGDVQLDLKAYRGSRGEFHAEALGRGAMEMWEKWTFPLADGALPSPRTPRWVAVQKVRRRRSFSLVDGRAAERPLGDADLPGCTIELREATVGGEAWWTLCLEASGPVDGLERDLHAAAAFILSDNGLPPELQLDARDSMSYVRWLGSRRGEPRGRQPATT